MLKKLILIAVLLSFALPVSAGQFKVTRVYDGDTFKATGHDIEIRVRLVGITRNAQNGLPEAVNGGTLSQSRTFNGYREQDGQVSIISGQGVSSWSLAQDDNGRAIQKIETVGGTTSTYDYTNHRLDTFSPTT